MVSTVGFDPTASCTRNTRSTRLSYVLMKMVGAVRIALTISSPPDWRVTASLRPELTDKEQEGRYTDQRSVALPLGGQPPRGMTGVEPVIDNPYLRSVRKWRA